MQNDGNVKEVPPPRARVAETVTVTALDLSDEERRVLRKLIHTQKRTASAGHGMSSSDTEPGAQAWIVWRHVCDKLQAKLKQSEEERVRLEGQNMKSQEQVTKVKQHLMELCRLWEGKQNESRHQITLFEARDRERVYQLETQQRLLCETESKLQAANATIAEMQCRLEKQSQAMRRLQKDDKKEKRQEHRLGELRKQLDDKDRIIAELRSAASRPTTTIPVPDKTKEVESLRNRLTTCELKMGGMTQESASQMEYIQRLEAEQMKWKPMFDTWKAQAAEAAELQWRTMGGLYPHSMGAPAVQSYPPLVHYYSLPPPAHPPPTAPAQTPVVSVTGPIQA